MSLTDAIVAFIFTLLGLLGLLWFAFDFKSRRECPVFNPSPGDYVSWVVGSAYMLAEFKCWTSATTFQVSKYDKNGIPYSFEIDMLKISNLKEFK